MYFQIQVIKVPVQVLMGALMWMSARKTRVTARMNLIAQIQRVTSFVLVNLDLVETDISAQVFIDRSKGGGALGIREISLGNPGSSTDISFFSQRYKCNVVYMLTLQVNRQD